MRQSQLLISVLNCDRRSFITTNNGLCLNQQEKVKAGFHMIADRRSQIAIRSAIVCDHMETTSGIVCDTAIVIADDRRR